MKKLSLWEVLKKFINKKKTGEVFYRKQLRVLLPSYQDSKTPAAYKYSRFINTIDTYRNCLSRAGFIGTVKRGQYMKLKTIPENLTITQLEKYVGDKTWRRWFIQPEDVAKFY